MNMQALMKEAQKMQKELQKTQKELENTVYEGSSSLVSVKMNGKKELLSININVDEDIKLDELELFQDMIVVAVNNTVKEIDNDKEKKMSKFGQGLSGLL